MTDDEQMRFCAQICLAARKLGIYGRFRNNVFMWFDPTSHQKLTCRYGSTQKETLFLACEDLVNYLCLPSHQKR